MGEGGGGALVERLHSINAREHSRSGDIISSAQAAPRLRLKRTVRKSSKSRQRNFITQNDIGLGCVIESCNCDFIKVTRIDKNLKRPIKGVDE